LAGDVPFRLCDPLEPAMEALRDRHLRVTVAGIVKREFPQAGAMCQQSCVLRTSAGQTRLDITTTHSVKAGPQVGTVEVYLARRAGSIHGSRAGEAAGFAVVELSRAEAARRIDAAFPVDRDFALDADGTVLDLLRRPEVTLTGIEHVERPGLRLVKVTYDEHTTSRDPADDAKCEVLLAPAKAYVVHEFSRLTGRGAERMLSRGRVSYGESRDGIPVVQKIEIWHYQGTQAASVLHEVIHVTSYVPGEPDKSYFPAR
jgi:hypothetical protein